MRRAAFVGVAACALAACGSPTTAQPDAGRAPTTDRGPRFDDLPSTTADRDRDGLCDATEALAGTDPTLADTDGDGLTDAYERRVGYDPLDARDPLSTDRVQLHEAPVETVLLVHDVVLNNDASVVDALWQDRFAGVDGRLASAWASITLTAIGADPASGVQQIAGARFLGVSGLTRLRWQLEVRSRGGAANADGGVVRLGCRRAYAFVVEVDGADGTGLRVRRLTLDVLAQAGALPDAGADADGFCPAPACE